MDGSESSHGRDIGIDFVKKVTTTSSPDYVFPPERIAILDNDGCL